MKEPQTLLYKKLMDQIPSPWPDNTLRQYIYNVNNQSKRCIVALDDDPTGTQTVHDIWALTSWDMESLHTALEYQEPAVYILTNSRSMSLHEAKLINQEIVSNLHIVAQKIGRPVTIVSRSDSTLRGHFPGGSDSIRHA
jgi:uncharacterized protein YgbK (DUF1537 family)